MTVVRGDLIHDRGAKQRTVFESPEPITGCEFREGSSTTVLYLSTTGRILTLTISGRGQGQPAKPLEDMGCNVDCMTLENESKEIVVVRDDSVYYYGVDGRGPSYAYEGPKQLVKTFKQYITIVSQPQTPNRSKSGALRLFGGKQSDDLLTTTFAILDMDLKYVAHTQSVSAQVKTVFSEWGDLFLLTIDGKVGKEHLYHICYLRKQCRGFSLRKALLEAVLR